jgi:hypothetical protein
MEPRSNTVLRPRARAGESASGESASEVRERGGGVARAQALRRTRSGLWRQSSMVIPRSHGPRLALSASGQSTSCDCSCGCLVG